MQIRKVKEMRMDLGRIKGSIQDEYDQNVLYKLLKELIKYLLKQYKMGRVCGSVVKYFPSMRVIWVQFPATVTA